MKGHCSLGKNCLVLTRQYWNEEVCTPVDIEEDDVIYYDPVSKSVCFTRSKSGALGFHEVNPNGSCTIDDKHLFGDRVRCNQRDREHLLYELANILAVLFGFFLVEDGRYKGVARFRFVKRN